MYAVVAHGGKQYRVAPGDVVRLEKIAVDAGSRVELDDVRLVSSDGTVELGEAVRERRVTGTVLSHGKARKVVVFKKKRRKQYKRTRGHRQHYTEVRVDGIE